MVLLKPRLLGRIIDDYWGSVLFKFNLGFSFITQGGRYKLGSFDNQWRVNLIAGKLRNLHQGLQSYFWPFFLCVTMILSLISCVVIIVKKIHIFRQERNIVQLLDLGPMNAATVNNFKYNK